MKDRIQKNYRFILLSAFLSVGAAIGSTEIEEQGSKASKVAETQIRSVIDPLMSTYCQTDTAGSPSCKVLQVSVEVDRESTALVDPGFDDVKPKASLKIVPKSAHVKLLMDEKMGAVARQKLLEIAEKYLSALTFPVAIEQTVTPFPEPASVAGKVAAAKEKALRDSKFELSSLLSQYCGSKCSLGEVTLDAEAINAAEANADSSVGVIEHDGVAVRISGVNATVLMDESLTEQDQKNITDMVKLKASAGSALAVNTKLLKFPFPIQESNRLPASKEESTDQSKKTATAETPAPDQGLKAELEKFKLYGVVFGAVVLALLMVIAALGFRHTGTSQSGEVASKRTREAEPAVSSTAPVASTGAEDKSKLVTIRFENERQKEELVHIFAESPKVAKVVFSRILLEEGVETTAAYMQIFGESIVVDMLKDPSLQNHLGQLSEYYARNSISISEEQKNELLRRLSHQTVAGKLTVLGSRTSGQFDFIDEMDGNQIAELVRSESNTVKAIVATQCDVTKRAALFAQLDDAARIDLMTELSRIDYLPRDYIQNVALALKRKKSVNPQLNTESLPGSEVLLSLLERSNEQTQRSLIRNLTASHPDSARSIKGRLIGIDVLRFLPSSQMVEVLLSVKHDELLQFLAATSGEVKEYFRGQAPKDLVDEIDEELQAVGRVSPEVYQGVERKILNRMKSMAQSGAINLFEINERRFADSTIEFNVESSAAATAAAPPAPPAMSPPPGPRKVA